MPDISAFCPGCGRSTSATVDMDVPETETATGDRLFAALAYVALLPASLFLILPSFKSNYFVRFHSWQSVLFVLVTAVLAGLTRAMFSLLSIIPGIGFLFATLLAGIVTLALVMMWCVLVIKALQGKRYELPWLGQWAATLAR